MWFCEGESNFYIIFVDPTTINDGSWVIVKGTGTEAGSELQEWSKTRATRHSNDERTRMGNIAPTITNLVTSDTEK